MWTSSRQEFWLKRVRFQLDLATAFAFPDGRAGTGCRGTACQRVSCRTPTPFAEASPSALRRLASSKAGTVCRPHDGAASQPAPGTPPPSPTTRRCVPVKRDRNGSPPLTSRRKHATGFVFTPGARSATLRGPRHVHDTLLLHRILPVVDAGTRMRGDGTGERVTGFALFDVGPASPAHAKRRRARAVRRHSSSERCNVPPISLVRRPSG